jgi:hypothetical protein
MALKVASIEDCLNLRVVLKNGEHGKVVAIKKSKGLITIKKDSGGTTDRYPENVDLENGKLDVHIPETGGTSLLTGEEPEQTHIRITPPKRYSINDKFRFMAKLVQMVLKGEQESLVITGDGGLGKTFSVTTELDGAGMNPGSDYHMVKGYTTAKGLYRTLYEQNGKLIIFDDCDEALKNDIAKNLLKGALDSYDTRSISWNVSNPVDDLPSEFEFTGQIIFISNMRQDKVDQAIRSRSITIDLSMSAEDKIARMRGILSSVCRKHNVGVEVGEEVLSFIDEHKDECNDLNMRTLLKGLKIRKVHPDDWKGMLEFTMIQGE